MADAGFIKYIRSEQSEYLLAYPNANHLLMVMAFRSRRADHPLNGLKVGQCFLGDYSSIGLTRQQYRTAQNQLVEWNLATFKGTNKGTVGTILNSVVYDLNADNGNQQDNQQVNHQATSSNDENDKKNDFYNQQGNHQNNQQNNQLNEIESTCYMDDCDFNNHQVTSKTTNSQPSSNHPATTNKEVKNVRKKEKIPLSISKIDEEEILAVWNEMDLKQHRKITDKCMKHIKVGYTKYGNECKKRGKVPKGITMWVCVYLVQGFSNYITDHHRGLNDRGWIANLEYALRPSTYDEVTSIKD